MEEASTRALNWEFLLTSYGYGYVTDQLQSVGHSNLKLSGNIPSFHVSSFAASPIDKAFRV